MVHNISTRLRSSDIVAEGGFQVSGHSKWSTIKRQKGAADIKRGATFTKMANAITIAAREGGGGDVASNFKLRLLVDTARRVNMPKENIQRAIDRGLGKGGGAALETVSYEGYAPGKVAIIVEAATDNKNRTTPEVRSMIEKAGGTFASVGAVSWMFADSGFIVIPKQGKSFDELFDLGVEAGADDVEDVAEYVEMTTAPNNLESVKKFLEEKGVAIESAELIKAPTNYVVIEEASLKDRVLAFLDKIESLDDVQKVWNNADFVEPCVDLR